ncbi:MAG: response regulator receiver protein [Actinomadura sp.]
MSSGVEADIALDAAVVLSLGMTRVLGGAAGLAASGVSALAALAEGRAEAREVALREAERYERAIRSAIDLNARISALAASGRRAAERHGLPAEVALPAPIELAGRSPEELTDWCAATETALADAERSLSADIAAAVTGQIFTVPAEALRAATAPTASDPAGPADTGSAERVAGTLARVLSRVLPDTTEADQAHIAAAAERLATAPAGEVEGLLTEVRLRVQAANERTEQARAEAKRLADEEEARRQAEAERRYVLDTIATAFGDLGYDVDTGFETMTVRDGDVLLTRGGWPEHAVKLRVEQEAADATGTAPAAVLRAAMLRAGAPESEEERRLDVEREREWCDAFEEARSRLTAAGIRSDVRWRIEPGEQLLPTAPEARRTRTQAKQRERQAPRE